MANRRPKAPRFSTPLVTLIKWPALTKPDFGTKEFPDEFGKFKTGAMASQDVMQPLIDELQPLFDDMMARAHEEFSQLPVKTRKSFEAKGITGPIPNAFWSPIYDEETEEETGDVEMKFAKKYSGKRKDGTIWYAKAPDLFDAQLAAIDPTKKDIKIYSGTTAIINFEVKLDRDGNPGYFIPGTAACGLSLVPLGIQIIDLVSGGSRTAEDYGFAAHEDGFSGEDLAEVKDDPVEDVSDDTDDEDDEDDF